MGYSTKNAESIVNDAAKGTYAIPELQRDFVWSTRQVLNFADSLSQDFPVGSILTWKSTTYQHGDDKNEPMTKSWLIDGQQRTTALCTLFGKRPDWWGDGWQDHLTKFDVRLDIGAEDVSFVIRHSLNSKRYIPLRTILSTEGFNSLAKQLIDGGSAFTADVDKVADRLQMVATNLKRSELPVVEVDDHVGLEEIAEIFRRLNSTGTRPPQSDIYLGVVASKNPGWVNQNFRKFRDELDDGGFDIEPAFLFRAFATIGSGKSRFKDIPAEFWSPVDQNKWNATRKALQSVCEGIRQYGIINSSLALSLNGLVAGAIYRDQFPDVSFGPFFAWMLCAIQGGFFSGPTETRLDRVIGAIQGSDSQSEAFSNLYRLLDLAPDTEEHFKPVHFKETSSNRNSLERLMVYLIAFRNDAQDWHSPGYFIRAAANGPYHPEWHHIFPRKWLRGKVPGIKPELIDNVANMAIISSEANKKIAASEPQKYVAELNLDSSGLLDQQAVPNPSFAFKNESQYLKDYENWLDRRSEWLAKEANEYLGWLRSGK